MFLPTASGLIMDSVRSTAILFWLRKLEFDETANYSMRSSYEIAGGKHTSALIRKYISLWKPWLTRVVESGIRSRRNVQRRASRPHLARRQRIIPSALGSQIESDGQ